MEIKDLVVVVVVCFCGKYLDNIPPFVLHEKMSLAIETSLCHIQDNVIKAKGLSN
jgi:hypothetical protein